MQLELVDDEVQAWLMSQPDDVKAELYKYIVAMDDQRKRNKLAEYKPYPKQLEFHASLKDYDESMLLGSNQSGKALKHGSKVMTPTGWTTIEKICVGDRVIAGDGTPTVVTGVFPQGVKKVYRLTFDGGEEIECCGEHLWKFQHPNARFAMTSSHGKPKPNPRFGQWTVADTNEIIKITGMNPAPVKRVVMPHCGVVQMDAKPVPIDPYVAGMLIGDGCLRQGVSLSSADQPMIDAFAAEAAKFGCSVRHVGGYDHKAVRNAIGGPNHLIDALRDLELFGKLSYDKRVPECYLYNSAEVRLAVLQGLMDTDGSICKGGSVEFATSSQGLADDVMFLVQSFGGKCWSAARGTSYLYNGVKCDGAVSYRVRIRLPHVPPFRLERKLTRIIRPVSTTDHRVLWKIEEAGEAECTCISVAHEDRTFVIEHGIVTHNTWAGAFEMAMHLTGRYPDDWPGHRFTHPIVAIAGSVTGELTRKGIQRMLIGKPEVRKEWGTGTIPFDCFGEISMKTGVKHAVDSILVKHVSGEYSVLKLLSYEQGQDKWQADTVHLVWFDEEPPLDVYMEGITRTNATRGKIMITFTPLHGMSQVVSRFYPKPIASTCAYVQMGVQDALHYTKEDIAKMLEKYPPHEQQARMYGIPQFGEGLVINLPESSYTVDPFQIPKHWRRGGGIDFGVSHPTACIEVVHDTDTDTYYVIAEYVEKDKTPMMVAEAVKDWGKELRWFWPHDGLQRDKGSLLPLANQYRDRGMQMWHEQVSHEEGGNSLESGVMEIIEMLSTGKLKIFKTCQKLLQEMRQYHRLKGLIVKENDDAISAMRYAIMMRRFFAADVEKIPEWQRNIRKSRRAGTSGW